ncbi:Outer membrane lipoprotein omp16 precursor [Marinobacterium lacunae]|uniref:Outer membrane lipoprotein omp16 n=1 Tax=Marinobacterium lacunae TaxID=1232683 RepID=A0A081G0T1_9GAMM|nr:OmpA family protein [Marinobacterium lacunae]KEA64386.1 Outer membrane lipoprotein omp16 precursor [Marinobacterium lacunae]MBR9882364.1 OmpA family protein [Oceanospirillales bacterium]
MKYKAAVASALSIALLSGCTTLDPYTQEQKTSQATKGAGIGALGGAILGAAVAGKGDRNEGALAGALIGGAVGGGIGYYQDQQEMRLRQELEGTGVRVERIGDDIRLIMPGNITFGTDSDRVDPGFYPVLDSVGKVLMKFDRTQIDVEGYTDSTGSFEYNQQLSERRASAVAQYLMSVGVDRLRLNARGYGERNPIADNGSSAGRAMNRRVEVRIRGTQR